MLCVKLAKPLLYFRWRRNAGLGISHLGQNLQRHSWLLGLLVKARQIETRLVCRGIVGVTLQEIIIFIDGLGRFVFRIERCRHAEDGFGHPGAFAKLSQKALELRPRLRKISFTEVKGGGAEERFPGGLRFRIFIGDLGQSVRSAWRGWLQRIGGKADQRQRLFSFNLAFAVSPDQYAHDNSDYQSHSHPNGDTLLMSLKPAQKIVEPR